MGILKRKEFIDRIVDFNLKDGVKLLSGIRGSGKTTLIKSIIEELKDRGISEENIVYASFDSGEFYSVKSYLEAYNLLCSKFRGTDGKIYLFLDHVEQFDKWQSLANSFRIKHDCEVYAAVNYSKFYKMGEGNVLGGRAFRFEVYPFSFREFIQYKRQFSDDVKSTGEFFLEYLRYGGMPEVVSADDSEKFLILEWIYKIILYQDMINDSDSEEFLVKDFLRYMVDNFTRKFSRKDLEKCLYEFENESLYECKYNLIDSGFMSDSNIVYDGRRLKWEQKYYLIDHAFYSCLNRFYGYFNQDLIKNIIYVELLRRGYDVFFSENKGKYIDFICHGENRWVYIQFDYIFASDNVIKKEIDYLKYYAGDNDKYIITTGDYDFCEYGVKHLNVIDFLLGDEI